jgi:hypothetical protein
MIDWLFRSRQTGRITVAQAPNAPLIVFMVAAGVRWIFHPTGALGDVVGVVATVALVVWALAEIVAGVNPWRRILGAVVLVLVLLGMLTR